jgi:hypothetical protein
VAVRRTAPDGAAWNPWRALRQRPATTFAFAPLGGPAGRWERDPDGDVILVEAALGRRARRVALAHELVHAERGVGHPDATGATMALEESQVRREVARRLVPPAELRRFVADRGGVGPVEPYDVAEEFDVTLEVADLACRLLASGSRGWVGEC